MQNSDEICPVPDTQGTQTRPQKTWPVNPKYPKPGLQTIEYAEGLMKLPTVLETEKQQLKQKLSSVKADQKLIKDYQTTHNNCISKELLIKITQHGEILQQTVVNTINRLDQNKPQVSPLI